MGLLSKILAKGDKGTVKKAISPEVRKALGFEY